MSSAGVFHENKESLDLLQRLLHQYKIMCYRVMGRDLDLKYDLTRIDMRLKKADVKLTPGMYISMIGISSVIITLMSIVVFSLFFSLVLGSVIWHFLVTGLSLIVLLCSLGTYPVIVTTRISKKKSEIDRELPFTLSELSVLASTGLSPVHILRKISERDENQYMQGEFKKAVYKIDIEGKDIITSLSETAKETPSDHFKEMLWDFSNMIHEGGAIDEYLRKKADEGMKLKRAIQKELIESLGVIMELYISLVLMGILMIGVGAFLIDAMGSDMGGMDGNTMLILLTYGFIPVSVIVLTILVSMSYSKME